MIDVPCVTAGLPGTGGVVRSAPEDFEVEELTAYPPSGRGEHVHVRLRKTGIPTLEAVHRLARALGVERTRIGYAGLKDARAVTTQTVSISGVDPAQVEGLEVEGIEVLAADRHGNKLKRGHLRGNRFRIVVREVGGEAVSRAEVILAVLGRRGLPNAFGPQRFGRAGNGGRLGAALWRRDGAAYFEALLDGVPAEVRTEVRRLVDDGDVRGAAGALPRGSSSEARALSALARASGDADRALRGLDRRLSDLHLNAFQGALFNAVLAARIDRYDRLLDGDVAWLHRNGAVFDVSCAADEEARTAAFEISPSGPLFGPKCKRPGGEPGRVEQEVWDRWGAGESTRGPSRAVRGGRRPLRVPLDEVEVTGDGGSLTLCFRLPPGSYATSVLREVTKSPAFNGPRAAGVPDPA